MSEVLVFDMDGVLVDVSGSYRETIRATVRHFTGKDVSREQIQNYKNAGGWNNDWALSQKIIGDFGAEIPYSDVVDQFQRVFFGDGREPGLILRERWLPLPGLMERLAARSPLCIFTGRLRGEAQITLQRFAPAIEWDSIVGDDDVPRSKPDPAGLLMIAGKHPGARIVYLGDTVDDARSARAASVPFIGVAGSENPDRARLISLLRDEGAIAVIENINEMENVLCAQPR